VEDVSLLELASRMVLSLVVVLGIMVLAGKVLKRRGLAPSRGGVTGRIEVLARQGLGRSSSVQLVRVGGKTLVLGVTDTTVSVLSEADPLLLEAELALQQHELEPAEPVKPGWGPLLEHLKERTVRH
jgi:flagellar protein FliO/FliZ